MPTTIEKLNCMEPDQEWSQKLSEIKTGMDNFEIAKKKNLENSEQHINGILPTYWEVFHTHNAYEKEKEHLPELNYDIGIFLVGFSSLPIVLSLAEINPVDEIYFLYSSETEIMLSEISDRIRAMLPADSPLIGLVNTSTYTTSDFALKIDGSSDPVQTFKRIKEVIDKVGNKRIALDLTGGKKTMLGGGFTGGSILGIANSIRLSDCDMFYVDSLEYDPLKRAPTPGTEFLIQLENPYHIYNVQSVQQAEKLFENHNYEAAAVLWDSVDKKLDTYAERYGLENEHEAVQNNLYMADCYGYWDAFDYLNAKDSKKKYGNRWGHNVKHTYDAIDVLDILSQVENKETLFAQKSRIIHYAVDRFQNAIRRMDSDRFEDAIVRFTQVIEMLCNYRIHQLVKDNYLIQISTNKKATIDVNPNQKWELKPLIQTLFGTGSVKLRNIDYHVCENKRLNKTVYGYDSVSEITNVIQVRNDFIHFNSPMKQTQTEKYAEALQKLAKKFLKNFSRDYCSKKSLSFGDLLELHRFYSELH